MKIVSILLIGIGLYLMISDDSKVKSKRIQIPNPYRGKYKDENNERLVEIINPNHDLKYHNKF